MRIGICVTALLAMLLATAAQAAAPSETLAPVSCLKAVRYLEAGTIPVAQDFVSSECDENLKQHIYRFDKACHCSRLVQPLTPSDIVAQYPGFATDNIEPGQKIYLSASVGAVRVVRTVEALGSARPGQRLFVKTETGEILSVKYEKTRP